MYARRKYSVDQNVSGKNLATGTNGSSTMMIAGAIILFHTRHQNDSNLRLQSNTYME
jgi:hypothetical protein